MHIPLPAPASNIWSAGGMQSDIPYHDQPWLVSRAIETKSRIKLSGFLRKVPQPTEVPPNIEAKQIVSPSSTLLPN